MFFLPLFDDNPTRQTPYFSWLIMAVCLVVFLWQQSLTGMSSQLAVLQYGFIPGHISGATPLPSAYVVVPAWATIFTSMFLHGGWMHIGSNMLYLWIFGDNVEESMGHVRFILFYAACGCAAAMAQAAIDPASPIPMIGASGGIAGILGAYLMLHPKAAIRTFVLIIIFVRFINIPAWLVLGVWIGGQFVAVPQALTGDGGGVAYLAHIGGFLAGMALVPLFKRRDVPLFGRNDPPQDRWNGEPISFAQIKGEARQKYSNQRGRKHNNDYRRSASAPALGSYIGPRHDAPKTPPKSRRRAGSVPSSNAKTRHSSRPAKSSPDDQSSPWDKSDQ